MPLAPSTLTPTPTRASSVASSELDTSATARVEHFLVHVVHLHRHASQRVSIRVSIRAKGRGPLFWVEGFRFRA